MSRIEQLLSAERPFLTDGGFETSLFFKDGFDAPEFAAITLMDNKDAVDAMKRYFDGFLAMAESVGVGYVLDTNTWRGSVAWAEKLGLTEDELLVLSRDAVDLAVDIRKKWESRVSPILVNGVIGPAGDGYAPDQLLSPEQARKLHASQVKIFADKEVDMISAITMTHVGEAIGITNATDEAGIPVVISFTVETDGRLPAGETIGEAINAVDSATQHAPLYYMLNCAHPDHFSEALKSQEAWIWRIGGIRANASRLSHAELDAATELDEGNPEEFGRLHEDMIGMLPNLRVVGGCCGTDHRHVQCVSRHVHVRNAA
jgi:homocysteine S-methyltransferase